MLIHHELLKSTALDADTLPTVVVIHGLFGEGKNLKILSDGLRKYYHVLMLDLRNHGNSFHNENHSYSDMALDVVQCLKFLEISKVHLLGHSMGGKVVMKLAQASSIIYPFEVQKLVVLDIAPVKYTERKHDDVFMALNHVIAEGCQTRLEASKIMNQHIESTAIIQFLLKSFDKGQWRFNLQALENNYQQILDWQEISPCDKDILFLIGANSDYVTSAYKESIVRQFPRAKAHIIAGAYHWIHADKPEQVLKQTLNFLKPAE